MVNSINSRDNIEGTHRSGEGEGKNARNVTPGLTAELRKGRSGEGEGRVVAT